MTDPSVPKRGHARDVLERTQTLTNAHGRLEPVVIEIIEGPAAGSRHAFDAGSLVVGSHGTCDLTVQDASVSRRHVQLDLLPGVVCVSDLGSRNGTFFLGASIQSARVPVGGTIRIGRTTLRFSPGGAGPAASTREELQGLVGRSLAMRRVFGLLERVGPSELPVLVCGETGTGKELVARALHALSSRASKPFVAFDCAAVQGSLIESELFGHVRGAFTGAEASRQGAVARADGGTLYLDGIDELALELQPKLLRVLESHEYRPVGSGEVRTASLRVIASARSDLQRLAGSGSFRRDLFFRLSAAVVLLPPLRDRPDDIPVLAERFARERGVPLTLAPDTLAALLARPWPGNVRELRNALERLLTLGGRPAAPETAAPVGTDKLRYRELRKMVLEPFERDYLVSLLAAHGGKVAEAAKAAGLSRMQLYRLLRTHGISGSS